MLTPGLCRHARKLMYCNLFLYETRTVRELYPDKLSTAGAVNQQKSNPAAFPTVFSTVEKAGEWSILHIGPANRRETETVQGQAEVHGNHQAVASPPAHTCWQCFTLRLLLKSNAASHTHSIEPQGEAPGNGTA